MWCRKHDRAFERGEATKYGMARRRCPECVKEERDATTAARSLMKHSASYRKRSLWDGLRGRPAWTSPATATEPAG
jgi:hypothetical protein